MKILLVENKVRLSKRLKKALEGAGYSCLIAADGLAGRKILSKSRMDLVLISSELPGLKGSELCKNARSLQADLPIIMLVPANHNEALLEAFYSGADDSICDPFNSGEMLARIQVLLKRQERRNNPSKKILSCADLEMDLETRLVNRGGAIIDLTPKEFSLLEYLLRNQGRVLSREEIAQHVWHAIDKHANVVDVYVAFLRKKIDKPFSTKLIHTKYCVGYIFKQEDMER
jgi:two-component system copper resistance phosphate regulon response regulator CusR